MKQPSKPILDLRLFRECFLLGFLLTSVMAVGQSPDFEDTLRLAERGVAAAQYNLGVKYNNGEGVPSNYVTAYVWLNIAAASGQEEAINARSRVEQQMTRSQIFEAQQLSTEIFERIQQGNQ